MNLLFVFLALMGLKTYVTPEEYGAWGDGIHNDTKAIQASLASDYPVLLENTYLVSESIIMSKSLYGQGRIVFDNDNISLICSSRNQKIIGITLNYGRHAGRLLIIKGARNVEVRDVKFENVGSSQSNVSTGMVYISNGSKSIRFIDCSFRHGTAGNGKATSGVWIAQKDGPCKNIVIDSCLFEDFKSDNDADAIKVIGQGTDCYLYVSHCTFRVCQKRAMKFQSRNCFSQDNKIYVDIPMYTAISFQCGHGSSTNDTIVLNCNDASIINESRGVLYRALLINQGHVNVRNLRIEDKCGFNNSHQAVIGLNTLSSKEDNGKIRDVRIEDCYIEGFKKFVKTGDNVEIINGFCVLNTIMPQKIDHCISWSNAQVNNVNVVFNNE